MASSSADALHAASSSASVDLSSWAAWEARDSSDYREMDELGILADFVSPDAELKSKKSKAHKRNLRSTRREHNGNMINAARKRVAREEEGRAAKAARAMAASSLLSADRDNQTRAAAVLAVPVDTLVELSELHASKRCWPTVKWNLTLQPREPALAAAFPDGIPELIWQVYIAALREAEANYKEAQTAAILRFEPPADSAKVIAEVASLKEANPSSCTAAAEADRAKWGHPTVDQFFTQWAKTRVTHQALRDAGLVHLSPYCQPGRGEMRYAKYEALWPVAAAGDTPALSQSLGGSAQQLAVRTLRSYGADEPRQLPLNHASLHAISTAAQPSSASGAQNAAEADGESGGHELDEGETGNDESLENGSAKGGDVIGDEACEDDEINPDDDDGRFPL